MQVMLPSGKTVDVVVVVERETFAGTLLVWIEGRERAGSLGAARLSSADIRELPSPVSMNGRVFTHTIGSAPRVGLQAEEVKAIVAAQAAAVAAYARSPRGQRERLTDELENCERGAFPGSAAAKREDLALAALALFDQAHPEVLAEIRREGRGKISTEADQG
jgi:hypothetical protein